jgi:hypothetical protein
MSIARLLSIHINIAAINIALRCESAELHMQVAGPMREFVRDARDAPDISIKVDWMETAPAFVDDEGRLLFDSGSTWRLYALPDGRREFRLAAPFSGWHPYKRARFSADWTTGEILCERRYFAEGQFVYPLEYPLDEVLVSNLLAQGRGVEIHACGLSDADGRGYLFVGQSGAGKSTTARLWSNKTGVRVLSDERVILRARDNRIWMYGTPWHGDACLGGPMTAPLDAIFFPARGIENELTPLNRTETAARLFACSFPPFHSHDGLAFTLEFLDQVTRQVPAHELKFVPDERAVDFLRERSGVELTCS